MEQQDAYIAYEDRTPKDLCQDINIKAEKFLKSYKKGVFIVPVICLVLVVLGLHFMPNMNWWRGLEILGIVEVSFIVIYIYTQKLIHEMRLSANPKQFLPIAKKLKECVRYSNYFYHVVSLWITISLLSGLKDLSFWRRVWPCLYRLPRKRLLYATKWTTWNAASSHRFPIIAFTEE